jgi:hypothetical protein
MGLIAMSARDLQRVEILSRLIAGRMTLVSASHVLDPSTRQVLSQGAALLRLRRIATASPAFAVQSKIDIPTATVALRVEPCAIALRSFAHAALRWTLESQ